MTEATDIHTLAGAYALDAVDDLERAAFVRHLHQCETCAQEVAELRETTARMAGAMAETPPPGMRDSVLAAIARTPQERQASTDRGAHGGSGPRARWRKFTTAAVAAGIVAAVSGLGTWSVADNRVEDAQAAAAQARTEAAESRRVNDVINASDAVARTKEMGGGTVVVVVSRSQNQAVAMLTGLQSPGSDELYQLWLEPTGTKDMNSVGVLAAGAGRGTVLIPGVNSADAFGLSVEPAPAGSKVVTEPAIVGTISLV